MKNSYKGIHSELQGSWVVAGQGFQGEIIIQLEMNQIPFIR
ncbi:hypothetical protein HMPREF9374_0438 [Desmospora sp. 8437]|nr:hypothetical protein HMPREF9374_0438 [Desmospora sp. 8437]